MQIEVKVQSTILPYLLNCNSYEVDFLQMELSHVRDEFNI